MADDDSWKYERIADDLRARIRAGEYAPGSKLPSKGELKLRHDVSDGPVNEALRMLRTEGLIETRHGSGSFVSDPLPEAEQSKYDFMMSRIDQIAEEVRQLRAEVKAQVHSPFERRLDELEAQVMDLRANAGMEQRAPGAQDAWETG